MSNSSRIPGFYKLPPSKRRDAIEAHAVLQTDEVAALDGQALSVENADLMVENVIGVAKVLHGGSSSSSSTGGGRGRQYGQ